MLNDDKDLPKYVRITDQGSIKLLGFLLRSSHWQVIKGIMMKLHIREHKKMMENSTPSIPKA